MTQTQTYYADIEGCDGSRGSSATEAASLSAARTHFRDCWPDARHIEVYSHATYLEREAERHRRAMARYDDYED